MIPYAIFTDATVDMQPKEASRLNVHVLPMAFLIDGVTYHQTPENHEMSPKDFYAAMRAGKIPTTSQIPAAQYEEWLEPTLQAGQDILFICFSSALTGSYHNACMAAQELTERYPDRKVLVKSIDYVHTWAEESRSNIRHWLTVDNLNDLKRGGRISAASAMVGTMLNIKPIIQINEAGALVPVDKVRGRKASLDYLVERFAESYLPDKAPVYVAHGDCLEDAEYCVKQIKEKTGVKTVSITTVGPIIGAHTGPSIVAILYFGKKRES